MEPGQFLCQTTQRDHMQGASAFNQRGFCEESHFNQPRMCGSRRSCFEGSDARMMLVQKAEKVLRGGSIAAFGRAAHRSGYGFNRREEHLGQWMIEWEAAATAHEWGRRNGPHS